MATLITHVNQLSVLVFIITQEDFAGLLVFIGVLEEYSPCWLLRTSPCPIYVIAKPILDAYLCTLNTCLKTRSISGVYTLSRTTHSNCDELAAQTWAKFIEIGAILYMFLVSPILREGVSTRLNNVFVGNKVTYPDE